MFTGGLFALQGASHLISYFHFLCVFLFSLLSCSLFVFFFFFLLGRLSSPGPPFSRPRKKQIACTKNAEKTDRHFMTTLPTLRIPTLRGPPSSTCWAPSLLRAQVGRACVGPCSDGPNSDSQGGPMSAERDSHWHHQSTV